MSGGPCCCAAGEKSVARRMLRCVVQTLSGVMAEKALAAATSAQEATAALTKNGSVSAPYLIDLVAVTFQPAADFEVGSPPRMCTAFFIQLSPSFSFYGSEGWQFVRVDARIGHACCCKPTASIGRLHVDSFLRNSAACSCSCWHLHMERSVRGGYPSQD